ncbi:MAG: lipocalin-like domain-containing protein [Prevotella sp.]|nr:lipocalin-like domain-containing protein [Bacteroides sp.]MCM1366455.1 lipocalin-like domain-containing protein [Prevotella sp.]MCM1437065.1 lipocalin-like domain-containing protein [Prevotella sp.]
MMKTKHLYIISFILITILTGSLGCTQNNGHIGPIFGRWNLKSIETVNYTEIKWENDIFWAFQNDVIQISHIFPEEQGFTTYGSFRLMDDTLFLDFSDPRYPIYNLLKLPSQCQLQVLKLTGNTLVLQYNPTEDSSITYTFHKW